MSNLPAQTKAFAFPPKPDENGVRKLRAVQVTTPRPGPGEVLVKIKAVSLNYRDMMISLGTYAHADHDTEGQGLIPVSDAAGQIVELGDGTESSWKVGDRVMSIFSRDWLTGPMNQASFFSALGASIPGTLTQYYVARATQLLPIPASLSYIEASTIPCAAVTAWHALFENTQKPLQPDHTVVVQGTGGVSIWAAQFALVSGARVVATTSSKEKEAKLRELGVKDIINYKETPEWGAEVKKITNGVGAHHILEIGGPNTFHQSVESLAMGGTVNIIGARSGGATEQEVQTLQRDISLGAIWNYSTYRGIYVGSRDMTSRVLNLVDRLQIKPVIAEVYPFEKSVEALEHLDGGSQFGKVVITVDADQ